MTRRDVFEDDELAIDDGPDYIAIIISNGLGTASACYVRGSACLKVFAVLAIIGQPSFGYCLFPTSQGLRQSQYQRRELILLERFLSPNLL